MSQGFLVLRLTLIAWFACATCLVLCDSPRAQERALNEQSSAISRVALLVGNSKYRQTPPDERLRAFRELRNPCNDVTRIAAVLEAAGWKQKEMIQLCDATRSQLVDGIAQFKDIYLSAERSFGFVYYAGHGVQVRDETFLFGVDSFMDPATVASNAANHSGGSIFRGGVRLFSDLISQVGDAGDGSIFIVVDACRETPIDQLARSDPAVRNLWFNGARSYPKPVLGVRLFFSTAYGELASDGVAGGSPFALAFEEQLRAEGRVDALIARVIRAVRDNTLFSLIKQIPDATGSLNPPPPEGCLTTCEGSR